MKVVTITQHDYVGVGYKYAVCARKEGISAVSIRYYDRPGIWRVDSDYTIYNGYANSNEYKERILESEKSEYDHTTLRDKFYGREATAQALLDAADVLHVVGDIPPSIYNTSYESSRISLDLCKPIVVTPVGSKFRRFEEGKKWAVGKWPLAEHMTHTNVRTVDTIDLLYKDFNAEYLGIPINCPETLPDAVRNKVPHITHSPSCRVNKGTDDVFIPAMKILQERREITYDIIEGVGHEECMSRKLKGDVFFGQKGIGWYATSTLEAAAYGTPSVCWLNDECLNRTEYNTSEKLKQLPIQTFDGTPEGLAKKIEELISYKPDAYFAAAKLTAEYVQKNYSFNAIGAKLRKIYDQAISTPKWRG